MASTNIRFTVQFSPDLLAIFEYLREVGARFKKRGYEAEVAALLREIDKLVAENASLIDGQVVGREVVVEPTDALLELVVRIRAVDRV